MSVLSAVYGLYMSGNCSYLNGPDELLPEFNAVRKICRSKTRGLGYEAHGRAAASLDLKASYSLSRT